LHISHGRKNAAYLASHTIDGIKEFGAENVVQVLMDGANRATWPIIEADFFENAGGLCLPHKYQAPGASSCNTEP
jgi:hypothetical protein